MLVEYAIDRDRRTTLQHGSGSVETVEHCLSALAGMGIDNALIRVDGPELPLGDGSAQPWTMPLEEVGVVEQDADRTIYKITQPIVIEEEGAMLAAFPCEQPVMQLLYELDYGPSSDRIGCQAFSFTLFSVLREDH